MGRWGEIKSQVSTFCLINPKAASQGFLCVACDQEVRVDTILASQDHAEIQKIENRTTFVLAGTVVDVQHQTATVTKNKYEEVCVNGVQKNRSGFICGFFSRPVPFR